MASVSVAKAPKRTEGIHKWATFKVALSKPSDESVRVNFQTISETAKTRKDFVAKKGLLTFAPGQRPKTVRVRIVNEKIAERTEGFTLALRGGRGVTLKNNKAGGTIRDND